MDVTYTYTVTLTADHIKYLRELLLEAPDGDLNADEIFDIIDHPRVAIEGEGT